MAIHLFEIHGATGGVENRRVLVIAENLIQAQDVVIERFPDIEIHGATQRDGVGFQAASLMITTQAVASLTGQAAAPSPTVTPRRPPAIAEMLQGEAEILTVLPPEETA